MFEKIMVPVDLQHIDALEKSLEIAGQLAGQWDATVYYVTVAGRVPSQAAKTPEELAENLERFSSEQAEKFGISTSSKTMDSTDVVIELDDKLLQAEKEIGADLIIMASHIPGVPDRLHLISSNAGDIAKKTATSVFIVR